jgi:hypothetical protein
MFWFANERRQLVAELRQFIANNLQFPIMYQFHLSMPFVGVTLVLMRGFLKKTQTKINSTPRGPNGILLIYSCTLGYFQQ